MGKNKLNKPTPKTQREISVDLNKESYGGLTNPNLPSPKDPEIKRASKTSFKGDDVKPFSIGIKDIDEAVFYYFENVIKPFVIQNGERLTVPVIYGSPEKWKSFQKDGYYRDQKGKIMAPLIMFKKESMDKNRAISNKLDANQPNNYSISTKKYNARNSYDNFSILTNRIPEKQYYATVIPDYVTITYTCVIFTYYVEQLNKIVESIEYASDAYWGDPQRFKFKASIDSFGFQTELVQENERIVRSTFDIKLNGYITPEILQKDLESIKKFTNTTRVNFEIEDQLVPLSTLPLSPSIKCADAFYVLQLQDGTVVEQGSIPSGESKIIIVPESGDATYTLTDSDGNILETGNIPAGSGAIIIAPDGLIQNSDVSYTASVLSDGLLTLPDVDILVVDENDNPLQTSTIPSIKNHTINVFCSPALVENSDTSYTSSVAAGGTLTLPDQDIEVNGVLEGDIPSVGTIEIDITDGTNPVTPNDVTISGRTVTIEVPSVNVDFSADKLIAKTGEIISFTNQSDISLDTFSWRFSNEGTSNIENPQYTFLTQGFKDITLLTGKVGGGGVLTKPSYIQVIEGLLLSTFSNGFIGLSTRKLRETYSGAAIRVRRSSDNSELDIGFLNDELNINDLLSFVGAGDGHVTTIYDQQNGFNATQTTAVYQPLIVISSNLNQVNNKPSIKFDGIDDFMVLNGTSGQFNIGNLAVESVYKFNSLTPNQMGITLSEFTARQLYFQFLSGGNYSNFYSNISSPTTASTNQTLFGFYMSNSGGGFYENGNLTSAKSQNLNTNVGNIEIGRWSGGGLHSNIDFQEFVLFDNQKDLERIFIQNNINNYYNVF